MYTVNMASGCTQEEALFVSLDDLGSIYILLDEDNQINCAHFNQGSVERVDSGATY